LKLTLLVMAAGLGSRFGGEKQLEAVGPGGETLLDYSIFDAVRAGFSRVAFVVRRDMADRFHEAIGRRYADDIDVVYAYQELGDLPAGFAVPPGRQKPWGTGQAVLAAASVIDGPFAVANADDFYGADAFRQLGSFFDGGTAGRPQPSCALVLYRLRDTVSVHGGVARGICSVEDGLLRGVTEVTGIDRTPAGGFFGHGPEGERPLSGDEPVSLNLWGFAPSLFAQLRQGFLEFLARKGQDASAEYYLPEAVDSLLRDGQVVVQALPTTSRWFGLTYREDKAYVQECLREMTARGDYPERLWKRT